jgi:hypothetical protein
VLANINQPDISMSTLTPELSGGQYARPLGRVVRRLRHPVAER